MSHHTTMPTDPPTAALRAMLMGLTHTTPAGEVYRAAAAVAPRLADDVLSKALTPIDPDVLVGDETQYAAFRQALLDELHTRALDEAATRTEQAFYDRASGDLAAADARAVEPGYLLSIGQAVDEVLRGNTAPAARGVHRAALDYLHTHALDEHALYHQAACGRYVQAGVITYRTRTHRAWRTRPTRRCLGGLA